MEEPMTRKHFIALATALAASRPPTDCEAYTQWLNDVEQIAGVCRQSNALFDWARFMSACGQ